ncbi:MAG: LysM peptidoglycan-binding domain-containing protein [Candidatus Thiodiazotropha sp.]
MFTMRHNVVKPGRENIEDFTKLLLITLLAISISACVALGPQQEPEPVDAEEPKEEVVTIPPPPDSLTPSQRVRKALQQLEQGDYGNARLQLTWALQEKPTLQIAANLLQQMDVDPIDHLGMKSFFYDVEPGDSLSIIAKKFLNDPLKFVVLARYNKLENPSKLAPGQRIRVPGVMPERKRAKPKPKPQRSEPVALPQASVEATPPPATTAEQTALTAEPVMEESEPEPTQSPAMEATPMAATEVTEEPPQQQAEQPVEEAPVAMTVEEALSSARGLHGEGNLSAAIYLLENESSQHPDSKELQKLLADYYNEHADQLINRGELNDARTTLEKLIILDSSDDQAINKLILVEDSIEAGKLMLAAQDQQNAGNLEQAYQTYGQVLTYDPENQIAKDSRLVVRDQLTDSYHRRAMQLFRKQELDDAIGFWNKILELNPNHSLAPGYKARALEMKQQLQKIEPGG